MNGEISFRQVVDFLRSLRGLTRWQKIQLIAYMVGSGLLAATAGKNEHEMLALAAPSALLGGIGYIHGVANPTTIGSGATDAAGRTHL